MAAVIWYAVAQFPGRFVPLGPGGIDPAWQWVVNAAASLGIVFGRDLVFTYGPLAFLMVPLDVADNLAVASVFAIAVHLCLLWALMAWWRRTHQPWWFAAGLVLLGLSPAVFMSVEGLWVATVAWLCLTAVEHELRWPAGIAAALAGVFLLIKTSLGVAAAATLGLALIGEWWLWKRPLRWPELVIGAATFIGLATVLIGSPVAVWAWWQRTLQVLSGYSVANSIVGSLTGLLLGCGAVAVWAVVGWLGRREDRWRRWFLLTAPLVLLQFRLAYVRQDGHELQLFGFLSGLLALAVVVAGSRWRARMAVAGVGAVLVCASLVAHRTPGATATAVVRAASAGRGVDTARSLLSWSSTRERLAAASQERLAELALPAQWHALMGAEPGPVGTLPWECSLAPANGMTWDATPTLQLYTAYTAELDQWSARHYEENGPRWIVNEYVPVGQRHQMLDAPATWRALYRHYQPRSTATEPFAVLLERREHPLEGELVEVSRTQLVLEAPLSVPSSEQLLFAEFDLRLNLWGRLQSMLFRVPPVMLRLDHRSGRTTMYRMIPDTAANGVLINRFPGRYFERYLWLWSGRPVDEVVRLTVTGPGTRCFRRESTLIWRAMDLDPNP